MDFRIAPAARITGGLLQDLVSAELGDSAASVVCYGSGYSGSLPALNAKCSRLNKYQQAIALREALGSEAVEPLTYEGAWETGFPLLGRKARHTKGKDIRLVMEPYQLEALETVSDFFVPYQCSMYEWRTWVYRKRHLGSYRKVLADPEAMRRIGRNHENGFRFERVELADVPEPVKNLARQAISVLQLDFGAVDILEVTPTQFIVLEVNTAPGVADARRVVIQKLAHRIVRWAESGFPNAESQTLRAAA